MGECSTVLPLLLLCRGKFAVEVKMDCAPPLSVGAGVNHIGNIAHAFLKEYHKRPLFGPNSDSGNSVRN